MAQYVALFMLSLTLFCSASTAYAGDVSIVAEEVIVMVKEKASCWKLHRQQERKNVEFPEVELDWVCGKESVVAYLYQASSVEAAAKLLHEIVTSPVQSSAVVPDAPPTDSYQFGDESYVGSYYLYSKSSYVFFRKGNIVVRIDSNAMWKPTSKHTLRNAVRFAQLFDECMPPPDSSLNRTRN